jgi:glycosyltransferase involved in cell wall biosynthesis
VLIGNGPEKEPAVKLIEERGLGERVRFLDRQVDVSRLLPLADLYLLLSEHESFGLTALEAMSCGVPVIGTSGSGMNEFLGDGAAGLLFTVGDIPFIAEGCVRILTDPGLSRRMSRAGRERAIAEYRVELITERYVELYRSVTAG